MTGAHRWLATVALLLVALGLVPSVDAHEATLVDLRVREVAPGDFVWSWGVGARGRPVSEELTLRWPQHCEVREQAMRCGTTGLTGTVAVDGVGAVYSAVILRLNWYSGVTQVVTLTQAMPSAPLFSGGKDARGGSEIARAYGLLGIEHILTGWDHLLFVISLLLLVGFNRQLVATITAFTVAHSLTLAASALGALTLRPAPVEASIALSIVLVASECLHQRPTVARRWPALVALLFGLVHGLGFAGALREIGLPDGHRTLALLTFNLGVEAGQLLVVGALALAAAGLRRLSGQPQWQAGPALTSTMWGRSLVYGIGAMGAYWTVSRVAAMITGT